MKIQRNRPSPPPSWWANRLLGLAAVLACSSWVFFLPVYLPPSKPVIPWTIVALTFGLLVWRTYRIGFSDWIPAFAGMTTGRAWIPYIGLVACGVALAVFPYPYSIGAAFLGATWFGLSILSNVGRTGLRAGQSIRQARTQSNWQAGTLALPSIIAGLAQTGLLLAVTAVLLPLVFAWAARTHQFDGAGQLLAYPVGWLLRLFGQPVEIITGGTLFLRTFEDAWPFTITAEKLFPVPLALFAIVWSGIILIRHHRNRFERLGIFWLTLLGYSILRTAVLILALVQRNNPSYFWEPWAMLFTALPLGLIIREPRDSKVIANEVKQSPDMKGIASALENAPRNDILALALAFVCGVAIIAGLTFRDPGSPKGGRVMINEHGSNWEWTTDTLNTETYSEKTTYNYYCLAQFLKYYYDLRINQEPLSPQAFSGIDVLILKIPTQPYKPEEIQAVVDYVKRGGSLWVIGDHTNVFGSSSFFNPLLRRFGYSLKYVSTHDMATGNLSLYRKPDRFAHPSVINLPTYLFATSCSMTAPWKEEAAILGYGLRADHLDYSQKNFFADRTRNQFNIEFGLMLQQAAGTYGQGRILVTTDSTPFSNFFIFIKGKPELALGTLGWLNRSPQLAWLNPVLLILGAGLLITILALRLWGGAALAGIILGMALTGFITDNVARKAYPLPQPIRPVPWVNFEREHSRYFLPVLRLVQDGDPDYLTFYVWTQRIGAVPREVDDFSLAIAGSDPVVMIDPATPLNPPESAALRSYLERGGRLMVINSAQVGCEVANTILAPFGLNIHREKAPSDTLHSLTLRGRFFPLAINGEFHSVKGGEPFFTSDQGEAVGVTKAVGKGRIWALSCGHLFRNNYMGQTSVMPDEGMRALFEVEFGMIREMLLE